jgi:hypothetical protein
MIMISILTTNSFFINNTRKTNFLLASSSFVYNDIRVKQWNKIDREREREGERERGKGGKTTCDRCSTQSDAVP